jgi:hypothetical protein
MPWRLSLTRTVFRWRGPIEKRARPIVAPDAARRPSPVGAISRTTPRQRSSPGQRICSNAFPCRTIATRDAIPIPRWRGAAGISSLPAPFGVVVGLDGASWPEPPSGCAESSV